MAEAPGTHNPNFLPPDIPVPQDDGAALHLAGTKPVSYTHLDVYKRQECS